MSNNSFSGNQNSVNIAANHDRTAWLKGGDHRCLQPPRTPTGKAWRIILLGVPGVGKKNEAERLCDRLGICHLATADVVRTTKVCPVADLSPAMQNALDHLEHDEPVSDEIVLNLVGERRHCLKCSGGFLLDGFPRTVTQAKALEQLLASYDLPLSAVIHYKTACETLTLRVSTRRTCIDCGAVYHLANQPPKAPHFCDRCGGKLFQREADRPESVKARMAAYQKSTRPLIDFYRQRGLLITVCADGTPEEVYNRTLPVNIAG